MIYELNDKKINIPDEIIENYVNKLELTEEEAIQTYLEDEGYLENEEVEDLTKKAKESGILHTIHGAKAENSERKPRAKTVKEYPDKEELIRIIAETLAGVGIAVNITNKAKLIEFSYKNNEYKLDLIQKRPKK